MQRHCPAAASLIFMTAANAEFDGVDCAISCSGYTGEDGFEISVRAELAERVARALLKEPEVLPIGLGARDSLRLEAGLCLYGHDIDETTDPVVADLTWTIAKRRKLEKNFPGAEKIMSHLFDGAPRKRVGIRPEGRAPAREGTMVADKSGHPVGRITSGGFGPSVDGPVAMGYVEIALAADGTEVDLLVRGKALAGRTVPMPFVAHRYRRTP
jgi:aminomethyltransferase